MDSLINLYPNADCSFYEPDIIEDQFSQYESTNFLETFALNDLSPRSESFSPLESGATTDSLQYSTPSPRIHDSASTLVISTAFFPGAFEFIPDLILITSDSVLFYVHSKIITGASENAFSAAAGMSLSSPSLQNGILDISDPAPILNVILHMLYGMSSATFSPPFQTLITAVDRMPEYQIKPEDHLIPGNALYMLLLAQAPRFPLDVYTLASYHELDALAVACSSHMLSFPLMSISDSDAERIGALYIKRLFAFQRFRLDTLKQLLLNAPRIHSPTDACTFAHQARVTRAWALASAHIVWEAHADYSGLSLQNVLNPLIDQLTCTLCVQSLSTKIAEVLNCWGSASRTIQPSGKRKQQR